MSAVNLLDLSHAKLVEFFKALGESSFRAGQVLKWIHQCGITDIDEMTNLSKSLRVHLKENAHITAPTVISEKVASDGTTKWLLRMSCDNAVETVFIPEGKRGTLCVSSQVGCGLNCSFCSTGKQGFNRDLNVSEIIGQLWVAARRLSKQAGQHDRAITNVVMMGMGEPLLNMENVTHAMDIMMDDFGYGLSKRRVTLSTSGLVPQMYELSKRSQVALAVSLHAPNDALRNELVPINKKYPIAELMQACKDYFADEPRRRVTFEYVMLKGVNDSLEHARQLARILATVPAKINLIPFNPFPGAPYERSDKQTIDKFRDYLIAKGLNTITRKTRGDDIDAACGQLVGNFKDKTKRSSRWKKMVFTPLANGVESGVQKPN